MSNAKTTAATEYVELICPVTPTEVLKVFPISMRRSEANKGKAPAAKLDTIRGNRKNL
jgi:hypothetical protein